MNIHNLRQKNGTFLTVKTKGKYLHHNPIKKTDRSGLCDCSDANILVIGDIARR